MPGYTWIRINQQDSEHVSSPKYAEHAKILNMTRFSICERYTAFWICQHSEHGRVLNMQELHRVVNMPQCLNRTGKYVWIYDNTQGSGYVSYNT